MRAQIEAWLRHRQTLHFITLVAIIQSKFCTTKRPYFYQNTQRHAAHIATSLSQHHERFKVVKFYVINYPC